MCECVCVGLRVCSKGVCVSVCECGVGWDGMGCGCPSATVLIMLRSMCCMAGGVYGLVRAIGVLAVMTSATPLIDDEKNMLTSTRAKLMFVVPLV